MAIQRMVALVSVLIRSEYRGCCGFELGHRHCGDGLPDFQGVGGCGDVVNAQDRRAVSRRDQRRCYRGVDAFDAAPATSTKRKVHFRIQSADDARNAGTLTARVRPTQSAVPDVEEQVRQL